ncbi:MAG: MerR family transcriptional regulator [Alphaproteobacteria bacterium PA4]|nr:MAG: MerR family transcriptional regulator [Alphaproteobacteria bacterium PA4]
MAGGKSDTAFRTISEAADAIGVPQHVLRFWETRFPQLQPLKRAGNRRYYRPADMALLERIRGLLQDQGLTIRGAQQALAAKAPAVAPPTAPAAAPALPFSPDFTRLLAVRDQLRAALAA